MLFFDKNEMGDGTGKVNEPIPIKLRHFSATISE